MAGSEPKPEFKHLWVGRNYRIIRPFRDYDGNLHEPGDGWTYRGHSFLPYEDGLTLWIERPGKKVQCSSIRLQWRPESQADIIDRLQEYIAECGR